MRTNARARPVTEVWSYRTLIANLAQRELRAKYKKSVLGWLWSLINPAAMLAIYTVVFGVFLRIEPPVAGNDTTQSFALYLFCGLVIWNFFQGSVNGAIIALKASGPLLNKVYFPPSSPGVANTLVVLTQTGLEWVILAGVMGIVQNVSWTFLLWPLLLCLLVVFALGVGLVLSILNVYFRDIEYLVGILMQMLFYSTPIIYPLTLVPEEAYGLPARQIIELNPLTQFVEISREFMYLLEVPSATRVLYLAVVSLGTAGVGWVLFNRLAVNVSEEL